MAYTTSPKSLLLSLSVLFVAIAPLGHGLKIDLATLTQIRIDGVVGCSATGNPGVGVAAVAGVQVSGRCIVNGLSVVLGTAITDATGSYSISINTLVGISLDVNGLLPCYVDINLPVTGTICTALPLTGTLEVPVTLISTVPTLLGGVLGIFNAGVFNYIPL